jgi:hypothetical protein
MSETGSPPVQNEGLYDESGFPIRSIQSEQKTEDLVQFVQKHPVTTALGALIVGYILGKIF